MHTFQGGDGSLLWKRIQNEIIELLLKKVLQDIIKRLKSSKYESMVLDCTSDVSHSEKMSFTVRFLDTSHGKVTIQEHFIGFKRVDESTGKD